MELNKELALRDRVYYDQHVSAYWQTRHFGGPEEGGWWYDNLEHIDSVAITCRDDDESIALIKHHLRKKHADGEWGNISSVNGGCQLEILVEGHRGEHETTERPHYE